ncbi:MAG: hypothetical protein H6906_14975, partial [Hyphomicrobiales bacterium]|nr:hypothetical protein [Hyphomicrobiales bacterium]
LATAAGPGVLLAAAPAAAADPGGAVQAVNLASHPVQEHIEVLEWAQREAALARQARAPVPARAAGAAAVSPMPSPVATQSTAAIAVPPGVRRADSADEAAWGGVAVQGGWFADTMLDALRKYQQGARLADRAAGADMARDH